MNSQAEETKLPRLTPDERKSLVHSIESGSANAVKLLLNAVKTANDRKTTGRNV